MTKKQLIEMVRKVIKEERSLLKESWEIEGYGVKGMKSTSWRKKFKNPEQMEKWCDLNDAEVQGTSYLLNGKEIRQSDPEYQNLPDNFKGE